MLPRLFCRLTGRILKLATLRLTLGGRKDPKQIHHTNYYTLASLEAIVEAIVPRELLWPWSHWPYPWIGLPLTYGKRVEPAEFRFR